MNITANIETIGVKEAAEFLQFNTCNRPLSRRVVEHLSNEMLQGRWKFNGETIVFDSEGVLRNGQHRLNAILKARWRAQFLVVRGINPNAFSTMDCGKTRNGQDALALLGHQNAKVKANALVWIDRYYNNLVQTKAAHAKASPSKVVELSEKYHDFTVTEKGRSLGVQTIYNVCRHIFSVLDSEIAEDFLEKVEIGENINSSSPEYLLRNRLIANKGSVSKLNNTYILAIFIKAWNSRRVGKPIKCLKFSEGEEFPTAI